MFLPFVGFAHELLVFCDFKRGICFLQLPSFLPPKMEVFCFKGFTVNYQDAEYNERMEKLKRLFN